MGPPCNEGLQQSNEREVATRKSTDGSRLVPRPKRRATTPLRQPNLQGNETPPAAPPATVVQAPLLQNWPVKPSLVGPRNTACDLDSSVSSLPEDSPRRFGALAQVNKKEFGDKAHNRSPELKLVGNWREVQKELILQEPTPTFGGLESVRRCSDTQVVYNAFFVKEAGKSIGSASTSASDLTDEKTPKEQKAVVHTDNSPEKKNSGLQNAQDAQYTGPILKGSLFEFYASIQDHPFRDAAIPPPLTGTLRTERSSFSSVNSRSAGAPRHHRQPWMSPATSLASED